MADIQFIDRLKGCLIGSVIGAELGFAKPASQRTHEIKSPEDLFSQVMGPVPDPKPDSRRQSLAKSTPFIDIGVKAYVTKNGRVTPEDFAKVFMEDTGIKTPAFLWDPIHTSIEILNEGMHPRVSGMGNVPCGFISAAMPAVGIYHFADPEYAYLDGMELASITQPRIGADWAGLAAAAIAAAFDPSATPESIIETVLRIAFQENKTLHYEISAPLKGNVSEEWFVKQWYYNAGATRIHNTKGYTAFNPIGQALPLLKLYGGDIRKAVTLSLVASDKSATVAPVILGAILGALHGKDAFPQEWREFAEPIAQKWYAIGDVVEKRLKKECEVISIVDRLAEATCSDESLLFEKVYGCILAGAIGNAMGSPVEGLYYWEIDEKYPGGIQTILNPSALENEDDNQMAMKIVETYIRKDGHPIAARDFGRTWVDSMNRDKFFVNCMGHCYDLITSGWDPRITGHWTQVTGSTVMCMEPVGIYHIADPDYAHIDATAISYMYQRGLDVTAAALLAGVVAESFRPEATVDSVCETAIRLAPTERFRTFDVRPFHSAREYLEICLELAGKYNDVMEARRELYDKCLLYHHIDPLELFGLALAMLKISGGDIRQAAIGGTNIGRDSDTIAGRAAMLAGILNGAKAVPADWVAMFDTRSLHKIERNTKRLVDLLLLKNEKLRYRGHLVHSGIAH